MWFIVSLTWRFRTSMHILNFPRVWHAFSDDKDCRRCYFVLFFFRWIIEETRERLFSLSTTRRRGGGSAAEHLCTTVNCQGNMTNFDSCKVGALMVRVWGFLKVTTPLSPQGKLPCFRKDVRSLLLSQLKGPTLRL